LHKNLHGDIFLISTQSTALIAMKSFPSRRLYQTLGFDGVESISPVYLAMGLWKNPETHRTRSILVLGFNPADSILDLPGVTNNLDRIKLSDVILFDDASRPEFGRVGQLFNQGKDVTTEIESRRIRVGGLFTLGPSFGADGNIATSDFNFLRIFPKREEGMIEIGILKLKPGADLERIIKNMRQDLPNDVKVLSKEEFIAFEKNYWQTATAIGFIFALGTAMGFIVGTVIVYQILYTDVADHLPEYATLKAMGYKNSYLLMVVFQEAIILSILGYFPGLIVSVGLYNLTRGATNLPMLMSFSRSATVLIMTIVMCCISGAIAVRKLEAADPADIF
jgi:putative ABC transport system permease protein